MIKTELYKDLEDINISLLKDKENQYYGYFSLMCEYEIDNTVPLIGVTVKEDRLYLLFNTDKWNDYDFNVKKEVVKHEILHISFGHMLVWIRRYRTANQRLLGIAMDLEINQYLNKKYLPEWGVFVEDFELKYPDLYWGRFKGTNHYYKILMDNDIDCGNINIKHNWCESNDNNENVQEIVINSIIENTLKSVSNNINNGLCGKISSLLNQSCMLSPVKVSINLKEYTKNMLDNSKIFSGKKIVNKRHIANRYSTTSLSNNTVQKILIAIDESGSVSEKELSEFVGILTEVCKNYSIELRPFDTVVGEKKVFKKGLEYERTHCGGTDLNCVLKYYNNRKDMNLMFVLTDGKFSKPKVKCKKNYTVFISSEGITTNVQNCKHKKLNNDMTLC